MDSLAQLKNLTIACCLFVCHAAVVYGNGVYFARAASYSARSAYSPPDKNGSQVHVLCSSADRRIPPRESRPVEEGGEPSNTSRG